MKKYVILSAILLSLISLLLWQGCKDDDSNDQWTDEDQQALESLVSLQEQSNVMITTYLQTMDTAGAIASLAQWFLTDPTVEWAEAGSQGVMVQYKNGFRGGYLLDGEDTTYTDNSKDPLPEVVNQSEKDVKSIPNKKQGAFINPHYVVRETNALSILNVYNAHAYKVLDDVTNYLDATCKLDLFADLDRYGYIHIYSHGVAWPQNKSIAEVYLMTGEQPSAQTSEKYGDMLKSGNISIIYFDDIGKNFYCISPEFIKHYNDFSQDTVLFYGGFCYSFQGNWPYLSETFANGAYFGYTWKVFTNINAEWAKSLFRKMADILAPTPWTTEKWLTGTPELPKEYFDAEDQRWVRVQYNGDAELALWAKKEVILTIQSTEVNGAPITADGDIGTGYTLRCNVEGEEIQFLKFTWEFGDGSSPQEVFQNNEITHSWVTAGMFTLKVEVRDIDTEQILADASVTVSIDQQLSQYETSGPASNGNYSGNFKYTVTTASGYKFEVTRDESEINGNYIKKKMQVDFQQPTGSPVIFNIKCEMLNLSSTFPGVVQITNTEMVQYWEGTGVQSSFLGAYTAPYQIELNVLTSGYLTLNTWLTTDQGGSTGIMPIIYIDFIARKK